MELVKKVNPDPCQQYQSSLASTKYEDPVAYNNGICTLYYWIIPLQGQSRDTHVDTHDCMGKFTFPFQYPCLSIKLVQFTMARITLLSNTLE